MKGGHTIMSKGVWFISYKLVEGASVPEFLLALEKTNNEVLSKKKGFISWQVLVDGDTWVDLVTWETLEDAQNAANEEAAPDPIALTFYSFMDVGSIKQQIYSVEKSY